MKLTAEHYYQTARERLTESGVLYHDSCYALSMYVAGLAVECLLRAFKLKRDPTFDEKHDIQRLLKASGIMSFDKDVFENIGWSESETEAFFRELHAAVNDVSLLWSNTYRFYSKDLLRSQIKKNVALRARVKGDILKAIAWRLLKSSQTVLHKGTLLWNSKKK